MRKGVLIASAFAIGIVFVPAIAQDAGKLFGSHPPRTCASRKGALNAATAKQYFTCDAEVIEGSAGSGWHISLVSDVTVEVAPPRPFRIDSDTFGFATTNQIDPAQQVYPIRGGFTQWRCEQLGAINGTPGKSCSRNHQPKAAGLCFKSSFGEWHCTMADFNPVDDFPNRFPPPTQP